MNSDSVSVTNPSANTVAVCATVTVAPSANACRAVPREPARYAATIVLPWPGVRACSAPHPIATSRATSTKPTVRGCAGSTSDSSRPPVWSRPGLGGGDVAVGLHGADVDAAIAEPCVDGRVELVGGRGEHVLRIRAQPVRAVDRRGGGGGHGRTGRTRDDDLLPPDAVGRVRRRVGDLLRIAGELHAVGAQARGRGASSTGRPGPPGSASVAPVRRRDVPADRRPSARWRP